MLLIYNFWYLSEVFDECIYIDIVGLNFISKFFELFID